METPDDETDRKESRKALFRTYSSSEQILVPKVNSYQEQADDTDLKTVLPSGSDRLQIIQSPRDVAVSADQNVYIGPEISVTYKKTDHNKIKCDKVINNFTAEVVTEETAGFRNIRDQTRAELSQDEHLFTETQSYHQAVDNITNYGLVLLSGPPGSGKSTIARGLLRKYDGQGHVPLILHSHKEWRQYIGGDCRLIVLLDCVFGDIFFVNKKFYKWVHLFRSMLEFAKKCKCLTVFTAYAHIVRELQDIDHKDNIFRSIPQVDLYPATLSCIDKQNVALSSVALLSRSLKDERHGNCLAISLLLLVKSASEPRNVMDVFRRKPSKFVPKPCREQHVRTLITSLYELFGVSPNCPGNSHQLQMAAGQALAGSEFCGDFLHECSASFLMKHVHTGMPGSSSSVVLNRSSDYQIFHQRLYEILMVGQLQEICQHTLMQNEQYLQDFQQFCAETGRPLHNLFNVTDSEHKETLLYWSAFCSSSVLTCWCVSQMLACGIKQSLCIDLQRVLLVSVFSGDDPSSEKVQTLTKVFRQLPAELVREEEISDQKMTLPFPRVLSAEHTVDLTSRCNHLKRHGSYHVYSVLRDGCLPVDRVKVFLCEIEKYIRLEVSEFQWTLALRRVQATKVLGVNEQDSDGNTYLHIAASYGDKEAVRFAVKRGASVTIRNNQNLTAPDLAEKRLQTQQGGIHCCRNCDRHGLFLACRNGEITQVKKLLCLNALVSCTDEDGNTALHLVCGAGQISIASLLIDLGADINARNKWGCTPLYVACREHFRGTLELLLEQGARPNVGDNYGLTPLHVASVLNRKFIATLLLHYDADINLKASDGRTALHKACMSGNTGMVKLLLEERAKLNVKDRKGFTPLHLAVGLNHANVVRLLCSCGARSDIRDHSGRTQLDLARSPGHGAVLVILLEHRARGETDFSAVDFSDSVESGSSAVSRRVPANGSFSSSGREGDEHVHTRPAEVDVGQMFPADVFNSNDPVTITRTAAVQERRNTVRRTWAWLWGFLIFLIRLFGFLGAVIYACIVKFLMVTLLYSINVS